MRSIHRTGSLDSMKRSTQIGGSLNNASSSFAPFDEHPDDSPSEPGLKGSIRGFISFFTTNSNGGKFLKNQFDQKEALAKLENLRDVAYQLYKEGSLHLSNFEQGDLESLSHCAKSLCKDSRDNSDTSSLEKDDLALAINMNLWFQTLLLLKQKRSLGVVKNNLSILKAAKKETISNPNKTYFNNLGSTLNYLDTTKEENSNQSVLNYLKTLDQFWQADSADFPPAPKSKDEAADHPFSPKLKSNFQSEFFECLREEWEIARQKNEKYKHRYPSEPPVYISMIMEDPLSSTNNVENSLCLLSGSGLDSSSMYDSSMTLKERPLVELNLSTGGQNNASFHSPNLVSEDSTFGSPQISQSFPINVILNEINLGNFFPVIACFAFRFYSSLNQSLGTTRGQLKSTLEELNSTNQALGTTQGQLRSAQTELGELRFSKVKLEEELCSAQAELGELYASNKKLKQELDSIQRELDFTQNKQSSTNDKVSCLVEYLKILRKKYEEQEAEKVILRDKIKKFELKTQSFNNVQRREIFEAIRRERAARIIQRLYRERK